MAKLEFNKVHNISALNGLKLLDDNSVDCIVTSPPYYKLRDYGHKEQIGQEETIDDYINNLVDVFMECFRVLKPNGTMWINISDTYNGYKKGKSDKKVSDYITLGLKLTKVTPRQHKKELIINQD